MRAAIELRSSLVPYIYTAARNTYDTGVATVHPLYYDYPSRDEAYRFSTEFAFGDDIIVAPVTQPLNAYGLAPNNIWVPPGLWVEWFSGKLWTGPLTLSRSFALDDIPVFVKAGSIIPQSPAGNSKPLVGSARLIPSVLTFNIFAFANGKGNTSVYEDDGNSTSYQNAQGVWTTVNYNQLSGTKISVILSTQGSFPGFPTTRSVIFRIIGVFDPTVVLLNGQPISFDPFAISTPSWNYDGDSLAIVVTTQPISTTYVTLDLETSAPITNALLNGFTLQVKRAKTVKGLLDNQFSATYQEDYPAVINAASAGFRISSNPSSAQAVLGAFPALFTQAISQVQALKFDSTAQNTTLSLLIDAQNVAGGGNFALPELGFSSSLKQDL